jgi:hypothetical protein
MKHPGHTYGGFVPAISELGMTEVRWMISITDFNNQFAQKENFEEIIHGKASPELVHDMSQLIKESFHS